MVVKLIGVLLATTALTTSAASAAELYVAPNGSGSSCSQSSPCSMTSADGKASPGDTIHAGPGTYPGLTTTKAGTAAAHVTWISDPKWGAKINTIGAPSENNTMWFSRGAYVDIIGFEIDGSNVTAGTGIDMTGTGSSAKNNRVHHISTTTCPGNGTAAILAEGYYGGTNMLVDSNWVHDVSKDSCGSAQHHGIYVGAPDSVVQNNLVERVRGGATIHVWHDGRKLTAVNNTLKDSRHGLILGGGDYYRLTSTGSGENKVANNILVNMDVSAFNESGTNQVPNTYTNNLEYQIANLVSGGASSSAIKNRVQGDPRFVSATDLHLKEGSPAIGAASSSYLPDADYDDISRSPPGDIGAYAYKSGGTTPPPTTGGGSGLITCTLSLSFTIEIGQSGGAAPLTVTCEPAASGATPTVFGAPTRPRWPGR